MVEQSGWMKKVSADPEHSTWFVKRFRDMAAAGQDLAGEARLVDAMVAGARASLTRAAAPAGWGRCSPRPVTKWSASTSTLCGRGGRGGLAGPRWIVADLAELDLPAHGVPAGFDAIVSAGNVMPFLAASTRPRSCVDCAATSPTRDGSSSASGPAWLRVDAFLDDVRTAHLEPDLLLAGWDLRPLRDDSDFLVAVLTPA